MSLISNILRIDNYMVEERNGILRISPVSLLERKNSMPHDFRTLAFSCRAEAKSVLSELYNQRLEVFRGLCNDVPVP